MATQLTKNYQIVSRSSTNFGEIRVYAKYSTQSIEDNNTYYNLKVVYYINSGTLSFDSANIQMSCGNKSWNYNFGYTTVSAGENTMTEVGWLFNHNVDGTLDDQLLTAKWTASYGGSTPSFSTYINVPRINRYPQILIAPDFNDEENPTITYSTISGFEDATYQACISLDGTTDNVSYRDIDLAQGTYTFNLTTAERNILRNGTPNSNTATITFIIKTTTGSTNYYSKLEKQLTIVNADPTYTHSETETNSKVIALLGSGATSVIKNASILQVTITPTALKGAGISSVKVTSGEFNETKTSSPYTFTIPIIQNSIAVVVTDSRGNAYAGIITKTLIDYAPVKLNVYKFERDNPTSSDIIVNVEGTYVQTTFGSTANEPTIKWKLDDGSYATIPSSAYSIDTTNNKITITNYTLSNALVYTSQGYFSVELSDLLTSSTETNILVLKGIPTFDYGEHDLKVNGDLYIADIDGENAVNVLDEINKKNEPYNLVTDGNEVKVGYQVDGYDVYAKRYTLPSLTNNTKINHGLTNFELIDIDVLTYANDTYRKLNYTTVSYFAIDVTSTQVAFYSNGSLSGTGKVTLYYIKTS